MPLMTSCPTTQITYSVVATIQTGFRLANRRRGTAAPHATPAATRCDSELTGWQKPGIAYSRAIPDATRESSVKHLEMPVENALKLFFVKGDGSPSPIRRLRKVVRCVRDH